VPTPTFGPDEQGRAIVVDQDTQTLIVYEGGYPLRVMPCTTGKPDEYPTPPWTGVVGYYRPWFESFGTRVNDAWWLFREWDGNYYIHGLPFMVEDGQKVYQDREFLGRRPVSHGCIRISPEDAEWLTWWNPLGVPCTIKPLTRTDWE
jgi:lipoprotein-anchoring transpeptidase ErfK/SrfK